jgi:multiple sugar transport system substrate-binding protein
MNHPSRHGYTRLINVTLAMLLAIGAVMSARPAAAAAKTITFFSFGDALEEAAYNQLAAGFMKKYPDYTVTVVNTPGEDELAVGEQRDEYRQRLVTNLVGGAPPDVFLFQYRELGVFLANKSVEPIAPYLAKSSLIKPDDFYPQALKAFTDAGGTQLCLPQNVSPLVVYYNKALFDAAKLAYPAANWTWADFLTAAKALTVNINDPKTAQWGAGVQPDITRFLPVLWANGGTLVDDDLKPTKFTVDTPEGRAALAQFFALRNTDQVVPDEPSIIASSLLDRFLNGSLGMIMFSRRLVPGLRAVKFDWDVAPLPSINGKRVPTLFSDGYCMTQQSKDKDSAWKFIEYAASTEGQTILAQSGRSVPSLKSVATSPAFLDAARKPANAQVFLDSLADARLAPHSPSWADAEEEISHQIEMGFFDGIGVDKVIEGIKDEAEPVLSRVR